VSEGTFTHRPSLWDSTAASTTRLSSRLGLEIQEPNLKEPTFALWHFKE
jgi:hypothetical protein